MQISRSTDQSIIEAYEYCLKHGSDGNKAVIEVCKKLGFSYFSEYAYVYRVCNNYKTIKNE